MSEDTIRTRALVSVRKWLNWRMVLHVVSWAVAGTCTALVTIGHKQADAAYSTEAIQRIEKKVDGLVTDVQAIKVKQASEEMSQKDRDDRMSRMEDNWDNAFQHAGDTPRPQRSRRAH